MPSKTQWIICSAATALVTSLSMTALLRADNSGELLVPTSRPAPTVAEAPATMPATQPAFANEHITPEARQMLQQMQDAYAALKTLTVTGSIDAHLDIGGENRTEHADFTGLYQSPDKFRSEIKDKSLICSGGEKIYTYDPAKNVFTAIDTDKGKIDLKMLGADLAEAMQEQDPSLALAISPDLADDMTSAANAVTKVDDVKIDNAAYPAIRIRQDLIDITLAMDPQTHLVRRQIVDVSRLASLRGAADVKSAVFTVDYPTTAQGAIDAAQFAWTPPAGAQ
jgi:outer membrane lipoprotein-sorting protein